MKAESRHSAFKAARQNPEQKAWVRGYIQYTKFSSYKFVVDSFFWNTEIPGAYVNSWHSELLISILTVWTYVGEAGPGAGGQ